MLYESQYYGISDLGSPYLIHHGVKGQKWGVRNWQYVNGSLTPAGYIHYGYGKGRKKSLSVEEKKAALNSLSHELDNEWTYGVMYKGKRINTETEEFDWKNYRTIPLKTLEKEKIGTCWDFVNYQHKKLDKLGIKNDSYLLMMDLRTKNDPDRIVTHTFTTFDLEGKNYWLESACYPKRGIHEIKDFSDAANDVASVYAKGKPVAYSLFKYNPEGMDKGLTGDEFIEKATDNNWVNDYTYKPKN